MNKANQKMNRRRADGYNALRVYHRAGVGKRSPRLLIKCGDCANKLEVYYDAERTDLEIGGVIGSVENWREILLPLLAARPSSLRRNPKAARSLRASNEQANRGSS